MKEVLYSRIIDYEGGLFLKLYLATAMRDGIFYKRRADVDTWETRGREELSADILAGSRVLLKKGCLPHRSLLKGIQVLYYKEHSGAVEIVTIKSIVIPLLQVHVVKYVYPLMNFFEPQSLIDHGRAQLVIVENLELLNFSQIPKCKTVSLISESRIRASI